MHIQVARITPPPPPHRGHLRSQTCLCHVVRQGRLKADPLQLLRLAATLVPFSPHVDEPTSFISSPGNLFLSTVHVKVLRMALTHMQNHAQGKTGGSRQSARRRGIRTGEEVNMETMVSPMIS
ncbi:hypothetical protein AMECASPLE_035888 [Ameca splendens]|uniref:Uncharacterized protein n=1 Tax=Ameca splendens TaxID=208324 RepID=A0ABV0XKJ7_9TELE